MNQIVSLIPKHLNFAMFSRVIVLPCILVRRYQHTVSFFSVYVRFFFKLHLINGGYSCTNAKQFLLTFHLFVMKGVLNFVVS
jgi:hypothetical protein